MNNSFYNKTNHRLENIEMLARGLIDLISDYKENLTEDNTMQTMIQTTIKIEDAIKLKEIADKNNISVSKLTRNIILDYLEKSK